jgi:organic hydroperoxide reductase OsmC/OhrA
VVPETAADSGVLANTPYSFRTRFENEKGTNPEELITAAHAGCFDGLGLSINYGVGSCVTASKVDFSRIRTW